MKLKVGLACGKPSEISNDEWYKMFSENGIENREIGFYAHSDELPDFKAMKESADKNGVNIWSLHMPFYPFEIIDPSSINEEIRTYTVEYFKKIIKEASAAGIDKFVIHPSDEPIDDSIRDKKMEACKKSMYELCEFAKKYNGTICVEDLPRTCLGRNSEEILDLLSVHDDLRVCFDTNHLLTENPVDFVKKIGNKIATLHVSDYDFVDERHWLPGKGKVNWGELSKALEEVGYNGAWMYEIAFRDIKIEELYQNAQDIFEGRI